MSDGLEYYEVRVYGYEAGVKEEYRTLITKTFRDWSGDVAEAEAIEYASYFGIEYPAYESRMVIEFPWEKMYDKSS